MMVTKKNMLNLIAEYDHNTSEYIYLKRTKKLKISEIFSVLVDETRDLQSKGQISMLLRYCGVIYFEEAARTQRV